jgi:hypothetical protein
MKRKGLRPNPQGFQNPEGLKIKVKTINMNNFKLKLLTAFLICSLQASALDIWVSPVGSDKNPGTKEQPMATLAMALRKVRELRRLSDSTIVGGVHIILTDGTYNLTEPVLIRPEDSGTAASPTFIEAAAGAKPVFSGGTAVTGWQKSSTNIPGLPEKAQGKVWVADAPRIGGRLLEFRQLWINNIKAVRASDYNEGKLQRILSVDKQNQVLWIPKPAIGTVKDAGQMEFFIHQWWAIAILRVKSVEVIGDSAKVSFLQPESHIEFEHPWPAAYIDVKKNQNGNSAFFFMNAIQLLDRPGEWYEDLSNGKIYYWPRQNEDMTTAQAIVPVFENLVQIEGTLDLPVSYVNFKNISFEHTSWLRPSKVGHIPLQVGMYLLDAYKLKKPGTPDKAGLENQAWIGRQSAGVTVKGANHINFERCSFLHMAATGLDFVSGTNNDKVEGCIFSDIGGTGLQMGFFGDASFEAHLPYDPSDRREVCQFERIANNLITNCTNEDWGCVGINVGYARDVNIEHNEVSNLNYSGICIGWGWTKTITCMRNNRIYANHIHHFAKQMYDVAGIYTLSAQPRTEIYCNSIHDLEKAPYRHDPNHWQYIYFDEGTSGIWVHDNWAEKDKFFTNSNGPGTKWENNGPQVPLEIKNGAGLEPKFKDLLNY